MSFLGEITLPSGGGIQTGVTPNAPTAPTQSTNSSFLGGIKYGSAPAPTNNLNSEAQVAQANAKYANSVPGLAMSTLGNIWNAAKVMPQQALGALTPIKQQWQQGVAQSKPQPGQTGFQAGLNRASGVATALTAPIAGPMKPFSAGMTALGNDPYISGNKKLQQFAMSPAGNATIQGAKDVANAANIAATALGGFEAVKGFIPNVKGGFLDTVVKPGDAEPPSGGPPDGKSPARGTSYPPGTVRPGDVVGNRPQFPQGRDFTMNLRGEEPKSGFAYSPSKTTETKIPIESFSDQDIQNFVDKHFNILSQKGMNVVRWTDGTNHVLDVSKVTNSPQEALSGARQADQDGVYSIHEGKTYYRQPPEGESSYEDLAKIPEPSGIEQGANGAETQGVVREGRNPSETLRPVESTGELKTPTLAAKVTAKAVTEKLSDGLGALPEYNKTDWETQATRAVDIDTKYPDVAERIAMGQEAPPKGVLATAVFKAVEDRATRDGDGDLSSRLASSPLTSASTRMGQEIGYLSQRDPDSPVAAIQEVRQARSSPKSETDLVTRGRATLRASRTADKLADFIKSIECGY